MKSLPLQWSVYANLQAELSSNRRVSERSWGTEAALNQLLCSPENLEICDADAAEKVAASERRRERRRENLRLIHFAASERIMEPESSLHARHTLNTLRLKMPVNDWSLLCRVGAGENYHEIALATKVKPGSLRTRVSRLRVQLAA